MRRRGFTLIELLVVLAIIATLATLVAPRYFGSLDKAKEATLKQNLDSLRIAIDRYHDDTGHYPDALPQLVEKRYLRRVPVDPITERDDSWQLLPPPGDGTETGIYDVKSGAPGVAKDGKAYAEW